MARTKRREKIAGIFEPAVETVPAISVVAKRYRTGIYVRLSVEDGGLDKESESFYNQERLLLDYVAGMLSGGIRQQRLSTKDISQKTGIPQRTVTERLEHPEKVRLEDLYKLADIAGIKIIFQMKEVRQL